MSPPAYLRPYLDAVQRHGAKFESLLWANPSAQAARFAALARWCELEARIVLDAGCGRADFLDYLLAQDIHPIRYIGLEAVETLAQAAQAKIPPNAAIVRGDFIDNPALLDQNAHVIVFCGSLNTLRPDDFYQTLRLAWQYTRSELAFNFLCSTRLAAGKHLTWHPIADVLDFAHALTADVALDTAYRDGDCTIAMRKAN
ncbi:MAG: class I SAM-dependent methyltransferase [Tepidisphaeraceae bacterium]|jgi:methyltransferase family protein